MSQFKNKVVVLISGVLLICFTLLPTQRVQSQAVVDDAGLLLGQIYDIGSSTFIAVRNRVVEAYLQSLIKEYVNPLRLRLGEPVYQRIMRRLEVSKDVDGHLRSERLVDELVPFLMAMREIYQATEEESRKNFLNYFRTKYNPGNAPVGTENSMFSWKKAAKEAEDEDGFSLDPGVTVSLLKMYDAIYLRGNFDASRMEDRLQCKNKPSKLERGVQAWRIRPLLDRLLAGFERGLNEDMASVIRSVRTQPSRLDALAISLVDFLRYMVCRHNYYYGVQGERYAQFKKWALDELAKDDFGKLPEYLKWANEEKRYAIHVVVDGLQGHLVEGLAKGDGSDSFIQRTLRQFRESDSIKPKTQYSKAAPKHTIKFLELFGENGYQDQNYLPFFRDLYTDDGEGDANRPYGIVEVGISTTPTISVRNLPIAKTGADVLNRSGVGTNVPNFHWVDRERKDDRGRVVGQPLYFFGNDALKLSDITRSARMKTMFERLDGALTMNCGAQYDELAHFSIDAFLGLGLGEKVRDFGDILCLAELERRLKIEAQVRDLRTDLLDRLKNNKGSRRKWRKMVEEIARLEQEALPQYLLYYNPWPDHFAHVVGPFSDEILSPSGELNRLDYWLGRITSVYKEAGAIDRTLFGMAGDHGLTPVFHFLNPEVVVFDELRKEGVNFRLKKISADEGEGPKMTNAIAPPSMRGLDVVVASTAGGNYMLDFFNSHTDDNVWQKQPIWKDLEAVLTLDELEKPEAERKPVNVIEALYSRLSESLDYMIVRETDWSVKGGVARLLGTREDKRVEARIERKDDRIYYSFDTFDLLGVSILSEFDEVGPKEKELHARLLKKCLVKDRPPVEEWCTENEWRLLTSFTDRPDSVAQLAHIYDTPRAGTINLFPIDGMGYNTKVPGRHAGESFHEKDAFVGIWGAPVKRGANKGRIRTAVNGQVPGTLYQYLTDKEPKAHQDGWGFDSLGSELLSE